MYHHSSLLIFLFSLLEDLGAATSAPQYGNSSTGSISIAPASPHPSGSITRSPSVTSSGCAPCLVFASEGGANILSKVIWYETPVPVTLDTVSIILSQYRNTTITSSTTKFGDIQKLNGSEVPVESSLRYQFSHPSNGGLNLDNYYASMGSFVLANGTDGAVAGGVTSFAYPTPYVGINGFILYTSLSPSAASGECLVSSFSRGFVQGVGNEIDGLVSTTISLNSTYYSPIPGMALTGTDVTSILLSFYENVGMDTSSFSAFLHSNTPLMSSFPMLASCSYQGYGFGPPAFKIPVSAMTATITSTTQFSENPPSPGSPVKPPVASQTTPPDNTPVPPTSPDIPPLKQTPETSKPVGQSSPSPQPEQQPKSSAPVAPLKSPASLLPPSVQPASPSYNPSDSSPTRQNEDHPSQGPPDLSPPQNQGDPHSNSPPQTQGSQESPPSQTQGPAGQAFPQSGPSPNQGSINQEGPIQQTPQPQVLTFGGSAYTVDSSSNFILGSQTLAAGSPAITVSGTPVSLVPGGSVAVIGSSTVSVHQADVPTMVPKLTLAGTTYTATSSSAFVIAGQTLTPGGSITVASTPIFYPTAGNAVVIGSSTVPVHQPSVPTILPALTLDGTTYTATSSSAFVIAGQTLTPGGSITVARTPIFYPTAGNAVVIGSSTVPVHQASVPTILPGLTLDGTTYTADSSSAFVIAGQSLTPGGSITVAGTPVFYPTTGKAVVIGSSTQQLSSVTITNVPAAVFTFAGSTYTANPTAGFVIGGQTLTPGGSIAVAGTPVFYPTTGKAVVIGSITQQLASVTLTNVPAPVFTFAGSTYTANPTSGFVIGGQTLTEGGIVTVSGTPISYASGGGDVVVGTSTEAMGNIIMNGFGGRPSSTGSNATAFVGSAEGWRRPSWTIVTMFLGLWIWCWCRF